MNERTSEKHRITSLRPVGCKFIYINRELNYVFLVNNISTQKLSDKDTLLCATEIFIFELQN